ncbi:hypothetical protein [Streptomyces sp. NPDC059874]|uniref:hypothetical protein n=1 Tax=Streptomyces sp. NPDC059874 TaxID=3346983 RepID=UPI003669B5A6
MPSSALPWYLKLVLRVAIPAACLAALYLSIPGEIAMARIAGWSEDYAWAMPICISVYAMAAGAIAAYRKGLNLPGQVTAFIGAIMALALAICAQSISHLIALGYMGTSELLVKCISAVPPLVIGHMAHMAVTPSKAKTAAEEKEELRGMIDFLSLELTRSLSSQVSTALSQAEGAASEYNRLEKKAGTLAEEAENLNVEYEEILRKAEEDSAGASRPKALTTAAIAAAAENLKQAGKKTSVENMCRVLGVSQATYYRYGGGKALTA